MLMNLILEALSEFIISEVLLLITGVLMFFLPEKLWKIKYGPLTKGGEPSEGYIIISKILGLFCMIAAVVVLILLIKMYI